MKIIVWLPFKKELNTPHANYNIFKLTSFQPDLVTLMVQFVSLNNLSLKYQRFTPRVAKI